jgi:hypothetical protein
MTEGQDTTTVPTQDPPKTFEQMPFPLQFHPTYAQKKEKVRPG